MKRLLIALLTIAVLGPALRAADEEVTPQTLSAIADKLAPALVDVEYRLKYDKGDAPVSLNPVRYQDRPDACVRDERPYRTTGYLVGAKTVLLDDPMIHPRFIERIEVVWGEARTTAKAGGWFTRGGVMLLELDAPLSGAKPLEFGDHDGEPWFEVSCVYRGGRRWTGVRPISAGPLWSKDGEPGFRNAGGLICDRRGRPVGLPLMPELYLDDSWMGSPLTRKVVSAADMTKTLEELSTQAGFGIVRVQLDFRSPRKSDGGDSFGFMGSGRDTDATRLDVPGVHLEGNRLLVLASLESKTTARLEKISVHLPSGEPVVAEFDFTLKRFGAFLARLPAETPGGMKLDRKGTFAAVNRLIGLLTVEIRGELRIARSLPAAFTQNREGWRGLIHPAISGPGCFLVGLDGALLAVPLSRRQDEDRSFGYRPSSDLFAAAHLAEILDARAEQEDPSNIPVTEQEENRIAWLGVILQPLDRELARANDVSELTRDGTCGGMVSYVYEGSPAEEAGIEAGAILIRVHSPDHPQPLEVMGSGLPSWMDDIGDMPAALRDRFLSSMGGTPWPTAQSALAKTLTTLGFGSTFELEYVQDGEPRRRSFTVVEAPTHYESAPRHKNEALGLTVRDLTFEVRRFFQLAADAPGVIVSDIEEGERAAVAGIMRFEIVTRIDDEPVPNVEEFERLTKKPGEHRLSLLFKTKTRTVKIMVPE